MADPQPAAVVTPAPTGPTQPAPQQVNDDGFERIPRDELQTLRRNNERIRGMEGFYQDAVKRGFRKSEDFGAFDKLNGALQGKKLTMEQMAAILAEPEAKDQPQGGFDLAAIEKQLGQKFIPADKFNSELDYRDAMHEHKSAMSKEASAIEKATNELFAEGDNEFTKSAIKAMLKNAIEEKRGMYPAGHPLAPKDNDYSRAQLAPHDEKSLSAIVNEIRELRTKSTAGEMAATGAAVNRGAKTPAGAAGTSASPKPTAKTDDDPKIGSPEHRKLVEREAERLRQRRSGNPTSAAG